VDSNSELSNNLSKSDNLLSDWLWSETHLRWSSEFLAMSDNSLTSMEAFGFLSIDKIDLTVKSS